MPNNNPLRALIHDAIDRIERHGVAVTLPHVRSNITVEDLTLRDLHDAMTRQLNALIPIVMKERGMVITDATTRERKPFWEATADELDEQNRIKERSADFDRARLAADKAVVTFLRGKSVEFGYEVYPELFADDIERIYRMHSVQPPRRVVPA